MRTVWVSFDTIGRDCLEAAAAAGAEIVGVVTLPGPIDPNRSGQCAFDDVAARLGAVLHETRDINADETLRRRRARTGARLRRRLVAARARSVHRSSRARASSGCIRRCCRAIVGVRRFPGRSSPALPAPASPSSRSSTPVRFRGRSWDSVEVEISPTRRRRRSSRASPTPTSSSRGAGAAAPHAHSAPHPAGSQPRELLAEAHPRRRDHRLGHARAVPVRLGACADAPVSGRVHVPRGREGDRLGRAPVARRPAPAGTIVEVGTGGPVVACGEGGLLLEEVQTTPPSSRWERGSDDACPRPRGAP